MKILANSEGKIIGIGEEISGATEYVGKIPADFLETFGLEKYTMVAGKITPVTGWVKPVFVDPMNLIK